MLLEQGWTSRAILDSPYPGMIQRNARADCEIFFVCNKVQLIPFGSISTGCFLRRVPTSGSDGFGQEQGFRQQYMANITLQVVDGFEKGRAFRNLPTPVSIGREEDNTIQLNDERVSRFHLKIQEDGGRIILTDLDSTNGTRVNGHPVTMRVLQVGDQVGIGRSLLVFGSPEQIAERIGRLRIQQAGNGATAVPDTGNATIEIPTGAPLLEPVEEPFGEVAAEASVIGHPASAELFPDGPPELPGELRPLQQAQLSDLLAFVHEQVSRISHTALEEQRGELTDMHVDWFTWQRLLQLEMTLAQYVRSISEPPA